MARIRTIKPEIWTDEKLTECSLSARLLFIGMLNFSDDNGNQAYSAKRLKMQIFPADAIDTQPLLNELLAQGVVIEYSVSGEKFLHIKGFCEHQVINRPSQTKIPKYVFNDGSLSTRGVITDGKEGKGKEGNTDTAGNKSQPARASFDDPFKTFWEAYPKKKAKDAARKAFDKRKPKAELLKSMLEAIGEQANSEAWKKDGGQYIPYPSKWLNEGRWQDECVSQSSEILAGAI